MADDIIVRMRVSGESVSQDVEKGLAPIKQAAAKAGQDAGTALTGGITPKLEEMGRSAAAAATVTGAYGNALAKADIAVEALVASQAEINAQLAAARTAYKAGEISQEQLTAAQLKGKNALSQVKAEYRQATTELNKAAREMVTASGELSEFTPRLDKATKSAGNMRAGMQVLGYQINDIATQFALGAKPMQIFAAQGGQVIQAVQMMAGGSSKLATFLTGGWGIALTAGVVALTPLVAKLFEGAEAAEESERANRSLVEVLNDSTASWEEVAAAARDYADAQEESQAATLRTIQLEAEAISKRLESARATRLQLQAELERLQAAKNDPFNYEGGKLAGPINSLAGDVQARLQKNQKSIEDLAKAAEAVTVKVATRIAEVSSDSAAQIKEGFEILRQEAVDSIKDVNALAARLTELNKQEKAALDQSKDGGRKGGRTRRGKSEVEKQADAEKRAYDQQVQQAERYIETLNKEAYSVGKTTIEMLRYEAALEAAAAPTKDLEGKTTGLAQRIEDAADAAERAYRAQAEADFQSQVLQPLEEEIRLLGLTGPARERAALALEEEAFKAEAAAKGISDVNAAWEAYRDRRIFLIDRQAEEDNLREIADLYEDLFLGGTDRIWKNFKREGVRVLSEIAAEYTLALLSGQGGNVNQIAGSALSRSPIFSIFGGGRTSYGGVANDNGPGVYTTPGINPAGSPIPGSINGPEDLLANTPYGRNSPSLLQQAGVAIALTGAGSILGGGAGGQLGGSIGSIAGGAIGGEIAALGAFGGPIGAIAGLVAGNLIGGLFGSTKRGSATIGGSGDVLSVLSSRGNSSSRKQASIQNAGSVIDTIEEIAAALGADVDASRGAVSIGLRKGDYRVDTTGRVVTKTKNGAIDFGGDEQAAIAYAIQDLIEDGVLTGISRASQNILRSGQDLESAIEKAALIESVPDLLKQRLDPLGFELDQIDDKFRDLAEALREGGASAEQIAQAEQLYKLEREDAIKSVGEQTATLKNYLDSLNFGSSSPLSLRQQLAGASDALSPYQDQVAAAQAARDEVDRLKAAGASKSKIAAAEQAAQAAAGEIDQSGLVSAGQSYLGLNRSLNASSPEFFAEFNRMQDLTKSAISLIDAAVPAIGEGSNPFAELTANNTTDMSNMMSDANDKLDAINDNIEALTKALASGNISWLQNARNYY